MHAPQPSRSASFCISLQSQITYERSLRKKTLLMHDEELLQMQRFFYNKIWSG